MTSDEAFIFLEQEANQELKTIQEQGAVYMNQGDLAEARQALDRAEQINAMLAFLQEIKERWKSLILPVVIVHSSEPDIRHRTSSGRLSAGQKTPQVEYYIPILRALAEMGGSATAKNVTDRVGEMVGERLNAYDRMQLPITHLIRWKDAISWLKSELAGKGYLKGNSPHGIWEITPEGCAYLEKNLGEKIESGQAGETVDMEAIHIGDVLISHKKNYHHVVESITGNLARILWLERVSGEPQKFYTYRRDVNINVARSYYDVIPAESVDRAHYRTPKNGWPG